VPAICFIEKDKSLNAITKKEEYSTYRKENKFQIVFDIAKGMQYLHSGFEGKGDDLVIHRDLKPESVMGIFYSHG